MTLPGPDRYAQVQAATAALFDAPVAVAVVDPRSVQPDLMPEEFGHVARAIPARCREFAAGRAAARAAMVDLGRRPCAIPAGPDRAPIWPTGLSGSISHSATLCAAVLTDTPHSLGIDIEEDAPLPEDLIPAICSSAELERLSSGDPRRVARLIFAAKEAAYKAQYPLSQALFGFDHLTVRLDDRLQSFKATYENAAAPFSAGDRLQGKFGFAAGHVIAAVSVPHNAANKG